MADIKVYTDLQLMIGIGEEWLVTPQYEIIAVFIDGMFKGAPYNHTDAKTLTL